MDTYMAPYTSSLFLTSQLRQVDKRGLQYAVQGSGRLHNMSSPPHGLLPAASLRLYHLLPLISRLQKWPRNIKTGSCIRPANFPSRLRHTNPTIAPLLARKYCHPPPRIKVFQKRHDNQPQVLSMVYEVPPCDGRW